jgi:zinc/manganese transport system substrate-binding protein
MKRAFTRLMPWLALAVLVPAGHAQGVAGEDASQPSVVVTTDVLGAIVRELTADAPVVTVLMPPGADPHGWQPSARDSEALFDADLVVANGLGLEEGLVDLLAQAEAAGVPVFRAADHTAVRRASADADAGHSHGPEGQTDEADDEEPAPATAEGLAAGDPHIWLDPLAMRDVVLALGPALAAAGVDPADRATTMADDLTALDAELAEQLAAVPEQDRRLVTGHGALGYFADRYDFEIVGTVVPGLSSSDEPSARDVAGLVDAIRESGARAVFTDVSTPPSVAEAVASETGVPLVTLTLEQVPASGRYADLLREVAGTVADALSR